MTKTSTNWRRGATVALTLGLTLGAGFGPAGCDANDVGAAGDDAAPISFRDGDGTWGPGKLNTNFLGLDGTYPLDTIPLVHAPGAAVRLHAVWTTHCGIEGQLFYASGIDGGLGITVTDGELDPARFRKAGKPKVMCAVAGDAWKETVWDVSSTDGEGLETHHYLMILDRDLDENQNPVYHWGVFIGLNMAELFNPSQYQSTCAEDLDPEAGTFTKHAYLVADLDVDPASGDFSAVPNSMFLACRSGAIGKSIAWDYPPWIYGMDIHELATRVVRADYCGSGKSFTAEGNKLHVRDLLGVSDFAAVALDDEAAWDLETSRATCVTLPRDHERRVGFTTLDCGDKVLPVCSPEAMTKSIFATKVAD